MSIDWKKVKKQANKKIRVPMFGLWLIGLLALALIIFADVNGHNEGYASGYNNAVNDMTTDEVYLGYLGQDFSYQKEIFWSTIMWEVMTHLKELLIITVLLLGLLFMRF